MSNHSTASRRESHPLSSARERAALPMRFLGRARLALDLDALARQCAAQLRVTARREAVTEQRVRDYCAARAIAHHRFEAAVLYEAFNTVSVEQLIDRLTQQIRSGIDPVLERSYVCTAEQRDSGALLRVGTRARGEAVLAIADDTEGRPSWANLSGTAAATGALSLDGSLLSMGGRNFRIDIGWEVERGMPCSAFAAIASAYFAPPARAVVGSIAADALARFGDELSAHIAAGLTGTGDPAFVQIERLLRFGRLTQTTRVYLLYWTRLRDFLIWSLAS